MNYKAELRGFALDRATKILEGGADPFTITEALVVAESIVDYLYIPDKDIKSLLDTLIPLIVQYGEKDKIDELILQLQQIRAEMDIKKELN